MTNRAWFFATLSIALLAACASPPEAPAPNEAGQSAALPAAQTEAEAGQQLEKKFQEAAKGYKVVQRDGRTLYCKREKVLGSTIPTMQCLSEAQLRLQVESMEELRGRMRSSAKCTLGRDGGGGGACGGS
jgi:uncharacterized lipoprotein